MIVDIVLVQAFWFNVFPNKYGVSKTMIPCQIMFGLKMYYHCHFHIVCVKYAQTY